MLKLQVLIFGATILVLSEAAHIKLSAEHHGKLDYFVLAQMWPQTSCWTLNNEWQSYNSTCSLCSQKVSNDWTLHGLWPNKYNENNPYNCDNSRLGANSMNEALRKEMNKKWPSYKSSVNNQIFWSHEWHKHGSCALEIPETNSISKYLSKALSLANEYNVAKLLEKSNIQPGGSYDYKTLFNAIRKALGVEGRVGCAKNQKYGEQYLFEVHLCLDTSFQPMNCISYTGVPGCRRYEKIVYPKALKSCH